MLLLVSVRPLAAQSFLGDIKRFVFTLFLPRGYTEGLEIRDLIRSNSWKKYRATTSDTAAMNTLFETAYLLCGGNITSTLLASSVAVLDHKTIPVRFLFGLEINLPLTIESQELFERRTAQLPSRIYTDSTEDRDKLQHFYFSAYLKRTLGMNWLCRLLGGMIESGESLFIIGGVDDPRDRHANNDGITFALRLLQDTTVPPATCLTRNR